MSQESIHVRSPQQDSFMNESLPFSTNESSANKLSAKKLEVVDAVSSTVASTTVSAMPQTEVTD